MPECNKDALACNSETVLCCCFSKRMMCKRMCSTGSCMRQLATICLLRPYENRFPKLPSCRTYVRMQGFVTLQNIS